MDITKFRKKLERYLKGTANETESAIVEAWYKSYQKAEDAEINSDDTEAVKNAIRQKINSATNTPVIKLKWANYSIAAGLLLVSGIALFFYNLKKQSTVQDTYTTLQTKAGEVKQVILPDSSVMWVNSLSRVRIPSSFNGAVRNILLDDGEVFLKVKHNIAKPFRVNTNALQIQVLGTSFNVNAYATLKRISVAVATGKVAVSTAGKRLSFLTPGQQLVFDNQTKTYKQNKIDISETQSWKDGDTYLTQAGFDELSLVVKNLFGIKLKAANKHVSDYQFTLRLRRNMPADEALKIISLIHNTHFRREGNEVVLY
jgi:transmembrane sensor